jgi:dTMP kinase
MGGFSFFGQGVPGVDPQELQGKLIVIEGADGVGRSTQMALLKQWLEISGRAVLATRLTRSALAGKGLRRAKKGSTLGCVTMTLFYATDFADRLVGEVIPALKAGFVVLMDRYVYTLIARALVRGIDPDWLREVYGFALRPDCVFYLRAGVDDLVTRVLQQGDFDYWESGMDLQLGDDRYDSFVEYQKRVVGRFDQMVEDYGFRVIDASRSVDEIFIDLKSQIAEVLNPDGDAAGDPIARVKVARNGRLAQEIPRNESRENNPRNSTYKPSDDGIVEPGRKVPEPLISE